MGDAKAIKIDPAEANRPHSGKTCVRCEFTADKGWGGVVWQSPENDWGDRAGGYERADPLGGAHLRCDSPRSGPAAAGRACLSNRPAAA